MSELDTIRVDQGFWLLAGNTLLHEVGVPVPVLPTALVLGARATHGTDDFLVFVLAIVVAMLLGNSVWFLAGRRYGTGVLRFLCRFSITADSCVTRSERTFARWGRSSLVLGRFLPGVAMVAAPLAGAFGMGWGTFIALSSAGGVLYAVVAVGAGVILREQIASALRILESLGGEALIVVIAAVAAYLAWRWYRRRIGRAPGVARTTAQEVESLIAAGERPLIVDVRGPDMRQADTRAIPGTIAVSLDAIERGDDELPRDRKIVLYCGCPNEASAAKAARLLLARGYAWARPLAGGLAEWHRPRAASRAAGESFSKD
jgi:membrane protein DedA with SNARE-associated domain/rhodanese-related sulfurtransferase